MCGYNNGSTTSVLHINLSSQWESWWLTNWSHTDHWKFQNEVGSKCYWRNCKTVAIYWHRGDRSVNHDIRWLTAIQKYNKTTVITLPSSTLNPPREASKSSSSCVADDWGGGMLALGWTQYNTRHKFLERLTTKCFQNLATHPLHSPWKIATMSEHKSIYIKYMNMSITFNSFYGTCWIVLEAQNKSTDW